MAKLLSTVPFTEGVQLILAAVADGGNAYVVREEVADTEDAAQWVADNSVQIVQDIGTNGTQVDAAMLLKRLADDGLDDSEIADGVGDLGNVFSSKAEAKAYKALVLLMVEQFNVLRAEHGMGAITPAQARTALINKYKSL